jgi:hypothetical protein
MLKRFMGRDYFDTSNTGSMDDTVLFSLLGMDFAQDKCIFPQSFILLLKSKVFCLDTKNGKEVTHYGKPNVMTVIVLELEARFAMSSW